MFQMSLRIKTYKGIEIQCMINWILSCTQFFFHEQYIMNNIIFKSCLVWSGRTIVYLTGILLVHFCFFHQMFTILNNSVMSFLMHVPLHNCTAVFLNKFLEVTLMSANFSSLLTRKKESCGYFEKYDLHVRCKMTRFSHLKHRLTLNSMFVYLECVSGMCVKAPWSKVIDTDSWLNQNPFSITCRTLTFFQGNCVQLKILVYSGSYKPWFPMWSISRMKVDIAHRGSKFYGRNFLLAIGPIPVLYLTWNSDMMLDVEQPCFNHSNKIIA